MTVEVKRITIRVAPELHQRLNQLATNQDVSLNTLAVNALEAYTTPKDRSTFLPLQELSALLARIADADSLTEAEVQQQARETRQRLWHERYEKPTLAQAQPIAAQLEPRGLLIPRAALRDWDFQELEVVRDPEQLVIRPKPDAFSSRNQVRSVLREAGMLYEPDWETPPPVSVEERASLASKLGQGQPLSEIILAERDENA